MADRTFSHYSRVKKYFDMYNPEVFLFTQALYFDLSSQAVQLRTQNVKAKLILAYSLFIRALLVVTSKILGMKLEVYTYWGPLFPINSIPTWSTL